MKISQAIGLVGVIGLLLAAILTPTIYATEDGQFPVFPTVIGDAPEGKVESSTEDTTGDTIVSPTSPNETQKTTITKTTVKKTAVASQEEEESNLKKKDYVVTNEQGVFSPYGYVKKRIVGDAKAGEEGVVFALTSLDAKPSGQGDLRYQIFYANNTGDTLRNVSIQVFLPKGVQYLDSDLRPDSKANGTVVYGIGKIAAGEEGVIQLETRLRDQKGIKAVIVPATMEYGDIDGGKHTVTAATSNSFNGKSGGLTASAIDSIGGFIMWLIVIILLVALIFVGYKYITLRASGRRA